jgi:multidrug efflux pump
VSRPLSQVAEIEIPWQYSRILRRDLQRSMTIQAGVADGYLASDIMNDVIRPMMMEEAAQWDERLCLRVWRGCRR